MQVNTTLDLTQLAGAVLGAVFTVAVPIALAWVRSWKINDNYKDVISTAVVNGAGIAKAYLDNKINTEGIPLHPDVKSPELAAAVQYVVTHAPDAVKYFNLTPEAITEKVQAKLGLSPPPVQFEELQPALGSFEPPVHQVTLQLHLPDGTTIPIPQAVPVAPVVAPPPPIGSEADTPAV